MQIDELKRELHALIDEADDEPQLRAFAESLRDTVAGRAEPQADPDELISFDADGRGYTAGKLGDMLDARVRAMERGEGIPLEEFKANRDAWRSRIK